MVAGGACFIILKDEYTRYHNIRAMVTRNR